MTRDERKKLGICYDCHEKSVSGKSRCQKHLDANCKINCTNGNSNKWRKTEKGKETIRKWRQKYRRGPGRFIHSKSNADIRGVDWTITKEQFYAKVENNCFYCGLKNDVEAGVGLDRLDNSKGYTEENTVSCCILCNYTRGDRFSVEEMIIIGKVIREIKLSRLKDKK